MFSRPANCLTVPSTRPQQLSRAAPFWWTALTNSSRHRGCSHGWFKSCNKCPLFWKTCSVTSDKIRLSSGTDRQNRGITSLKRQGCANHLSRTHKPSNPEAVVPLQQVNISGIFNASARHGSSEVANLNSAFAFRIFLVFFFLFLKLPAIPLHRSRHLWKRAT